LKGLLRSTERSFWSRWDLYGKISMEVREISMKRRT
jgi:hypothetical protein